MKIIAGGFSMEYYTPPMANASQLKRVFMEQLLADDVLVLFPLDVRSYNGLAQKYTKGRLVSFYMENGIPKVANDGDPCHLGASMYYIKDVSIKPYAELTDCEVAMICKSNPKFQEKREQDKVCIKKDAYVTLIRFNLSNALHFSQSPSQILPKYLIH